MADEVVVIDVQAKFTDKMSSGMNSAKKAANEFEKAVENTTKALDNETKKKRKINLGINDQATSGIKKVLSSAKSFANKRFKGILEFADKATPIISKITSSAKSFAGKVWKGTMSIIDKATTPIANIKNKLLSIQSLITAIAASAVIKITVLNPLEYADTLTSAQIFFETKLGDTSKAEKYMNDVKEFAKVTPFDTTQVIQASQKMLAYGFAADKSLGILEKIGNTSAALGKGEEGIDSITTALGQMKLKGKLSAQEMLQLTEAGVNGWGYIAKALGVSTGKVQEMCEDGLIPVDTAINAIIDGMSEFDGLMDKTAKKTAKGLWSQLKDTFQLSIVEKWATGLQTGAVKGLSNVLDWLDKIDPLLESAGTSLEKWGTELSTTVFNGLDKVLNRASDAMGSDAFKNADGFGKIKILWDEVIWQPFSDWWENKGKAKIAKKMEDFGKTLGEGISNGLLTLLGFDVSGAVNDGTSIGASFAEGFKSGFDGDAVGQALWDAISKTFKTGVRALFGIGTDSDTGEANGSSPSASNKLAGAAVVYGAVKAAPTLVKGGKAVYKGAKTVKGAIDVGKGVTALSDAGTGSAILAKAVGSTGNAMVGGSGLLGTASSAGYALTGGAATSTLSGGAAAAIGGGAIAAGVLGAAGLVDAGIDVYKGVKSTNKKDKKTNYLKGGSKAGMVGTGAAAGAVIGSIIPGAGTAAGALVGAGVGGIAALATGDKAGQALSDSTDKGGALSKAWEATKEFFTVDIPDAASTMGTAISTFFSETLPTKWSEFWTGVGDFFTETIPSALESAGEKISTFFTETIPEKWDEFWEGVDTFFTEKIPYALGYVAGLIVTFFTETLPTKWDEFWTGVSEFFTETVPTALETVGEKISTFFTETIPAKWDEFWTGVDTFFTETIPTALETVGEKLTIFFTETVPAKWDEFWTGVDTFFTETIPTSLEAVGEKLTVFFTETIPAKWDEFWTGVDSFFTETIPTALETIGSGITTFFTETIPGFFTGLWSDISGWISEKASSFWSNLKEGFGAGKNSGKATKNAAGGFIGTKTLSWLAEEGTPEMVIPLGTQRRGRAISLWKQTGSLLGVTPQRNALGGIVGSDDTTSNKSGKDVSFMQTGGGFSIQIGNINFNINATGNGGDILAAIKAKKDEIVNILSQSIYEALVAQFENMPLAG